MSVDAGLLVQFIHRIGDVNKSSATTEMPTVAQRHPKISMDVGFPFREPIGTPIYYEIAVLCMTFGTLIANTSLIC